ncbi:RDD family protein [Aliisedimentitalea scapharcae]|uniref:RDD family protein n=1 Tax=Aliisedimentitalea scapharcae TaxID=1524259 RepID=A0ABZ2XP72_9RHOB
MTALPDPHSHPQFYDSVPAKRLFAWVVDSLVILAISFVVVLFTAFIGLFIWPLLYLVVGFAYRVVTLSNGSATWGMRVAGVELRDAQGDRLDGSMALFHTAGYTISLAFPLIQVVSIIMMLTGARGQGLTDAFLGTVALNRRA